MDDAAKLSMIKTILGISNTGEDATLSTYLSASEQELLAWKYGYSAVDNRPVSIPADDEMTQIFAVVAGYSQRGAENQSSHAENGISRSFIHSDMVKYIRENCIAVAGVR